MTDDILGTPAPAASAAPAETVSTPSSSADTGAPAPSSSTTGMQDMTALFTAEAPVAPAVPSAPGSPADAPPAASAGEGPQTSAAAPAADAGVTPPAGEAPAAAAPPAAEPNPEVLRMQQELSQARQQAESAQMFAELGIHPSKAPEWAAYAKALDFGDDIRGAYDFAQQVQQTTQKIADATTQMIAPQVEAFVGQGFSEEEAVALAKQQMGPMLEQYERTEKMLLDQTRIAKSAQSKLDAAAATEARVAQETLQRGIQEATQYAVQKWGVTTLPENTARIFSETPAETIRSITDDMETVFQSRLASEKSKWAAESANRPGNFAPMGANSGTAPASSSMENTAVNAQSLTDLFNHAFNNGTTASWGATQN